MSESRHEPRSDWKARLDTFLEALRREERDVAQEHARLEAVAKGYLHDTALPALEAFRAELERFGRQVSVEAESDGRKQVARITAEYHGACELDYRVSVAPRGGQLAVTALYANLTASDTAPRPAQASPSSQSSTSSTSSKDVLNYLFRPNATDRQLPTQDELLNHLVTIFKQGARRSPYTL